MRSSSRGTSPKGDVTITSSTACGFWAPQTASRNLRCVFDSAYGFRAEQGRSTRTRALGGFAYVSASRLRDRASAGGQSDYAVYARIGPPETEAWYSCQAKCRRSSSRTTAVDHGSFTTRRSTNSRSRCARIAIATYRASSKRARVLCPSRSVPALFGAHAGHVQAAGSTSSAAHEPSPVWNRPSVDSYAIRVESNKSTPHHASTARLPGVAIPGTYRRRAYPMARRSSSSAATNTFGRRRYAIA